MPDYHENTDAATGVRTVTEDNGDGTGTRTTYDANGNVTGTEALTGLPLSVEPEPTQAEIVAAYATVLADAQTMEEQRDAAADLATALAALETP